RGFWSLCTGGGSLRGGGRSLRVLAHPVPDVEYSPRKLWSARCGTTPAAAAAVWRGRFGAQRGRSHGLGRLEGQGGRGCRAVPVLKPGFGIDAICADGDRNIRRTPKRRVSAAPSRVADGSCDDACLPRAAAAWAGHRLHRLSHTVRGNLF